MPGLSDVIENFIKVLINDARNDTVEIKRNELAQYFNCAPSQINYVLTTRFSNDKGYFIESKRGGGGYIKIVKVNINSNHHIWDGIFNFIGESITKSKAYRLIESFAEKELITKREGNMMKMAISDRALCIDSDNKNELRASILKDMLLVLLKE